MQMPSRPMSLLIVSHDQNEGALLCLGLQEAMKSDLSHVDVVTDPKMASKIYKQNHPDVILIFGFNSGYSEATVLNIRSIDGRRHTGIVVMAAMDESFDSLAINNYNAGADDVVSSNLSIAILRAKLITVFNHKIAADELRSAVHKLQAMNLTDELTGLANMRGFLKRFSASLKDVSDRVCGLAVIMMDLDHFKKVNDTMNHMVGSHVIKSVGHILAKNTVFDPKDYAARYGGDEYIIVLHGSDEKSLCLKADQIRSAIAKSEFKFQDFHIKLTCSIGLCWVPPGFKGKPEDIVKGADCMLYKSKENGRNKVTGMTLRYPINFDHIGGAHLIDWDTGGHHDRVPRRNHA